MKPLFLTMLCCMLSYMITAQEFMPLFNGKNLDGWKVSTENPNSFLVEDGLLVCRGGRAHLFYDGENGASDFKNFGLKTT